MIPRICFSLLAPALLALFFAVADGRAQAPGLFNPMMLGAATVKVLTYAGSESKPTSQASPITFDNGGGHFGIGTARADRNVHVAVISNSATPGISSLTICGVAGGSNITQVNAGGTARAAILSAPVPTGTTCDIVISTQTAGNWGRSAVAVWYSTGASSIATATASDSACTSCNLSVTTVAGGFILAVFVQNNNATPNSWTAGVTTVDTYAYGAVAYASFANNTATGGGTTTVTATIALPTGVVASAASF